MRAELSARQIVAPKVLHGCLAAGTDIYVRRLARNVLGERYVSAAVRVPHAPPLEHRAR